MLLLRYYKGLTQTRAARVLGVSQVQVSRLERRAVERLRQTLAPEIPIISRFTMIASST